MIKFLTTIFAYVLIIGGWQKYGQISESNPHMHIGKVLSYNREKNRLAQREELIQYKAIGHPTKCSHLIPLTASKNKVLICRVLTSDSAKR